MAYSEGEKETILQAVRDLLLGKPVLLFADNGVSYKQYPLGSMASQIARLRPIREDRKYLWAVYNKQGCFLSAYEGEHEIPCEYRDILFFDIVTMEEKTSA